MIYKEIYKDLFSVPDTYYLAHCISADFAMGKGIAVEFNKRFAMKRMLQQAYPNYQIIYKNHRIGGDCILNGRVLNLITKERYYEKPSIITMRLALQKMRDICETQHITQIAMPMIGAGLDRLSWKSVSEQIQMIFKDMDIEILVCKWR